MFKCKDCQKRHLHCHSTCEDYIQEKKELDEKNEKIRKAKEEDSLVTSYVVDNKRKQKRRKNRT